MYSLIYFCGDYWVVHSVKVYAVHPMGYQVNYLVNSVGNTRIPKRFGAALIFLHYSFKFLGQVHTAQRHHALNLFCIGDRHDTRLYRHIYIHKRTALFKIIKVPVVKKQLGYKLACAAVNLGF